jgi:hypothetical protein
MRSFVLCQVRVPIANIACTLYEHGWALEYFLWLVSDSATTMESTRKRMEEGRRCVISDLLATGEYGYITAPFGRHIAVLFSRHNDLHRVSVLFHRFFWRHFAFCLMLGWTQSFVRRAGASSRCTYIQEH